MSTGGEARRYLRRQHHGVLSTLSKKLDGYPFGSVVPFVTDHAARPVILVSRLAEHTKNIAADPRVSLLVRDSNDQPQESARLTVVADARAVTENVAAIQARYLRYLPDAERLLALGDFSFYALEPKTLRFIAGFGEIHWVSAQQFAPPANSLANCESGIVAHMNEDHRSTLTDYCRQTRPVSPESVLMTGIDCDGFDLCADGQTLRFDFPQPVLDAESARAALVEMARKARS